MKCSKMAKKGSGRKKIGMLVVLLLLAFLISSCSTINIEAAKSLSVTGHNAALQARENAIVSEDEYLRTRDSEALLAGFSGDTESDRYKEILSLFKDIYQELTKRAVVFTNLADLYDAFGELASLDTGAQVEKGLVDLGGAIEEYAKAIHQPLPSPTAGDVTAVISKIGGLVGTEIQKAKIKEASMQIRVKVDAFLELLSSPLVRRQMQGFRKFLASDRKTMLMMLWDSGVYDAKPLLDDLGAPAKLVTTKDADSLVKNNPGLKKALTEVLAMRLTNQMDLIDQGYDASLGVLKNLISQHKKLEEGQPLDLTQIRALVAQLRSIAVMLGKVKQDISTKK
jgi:hypothetical protein